MAFTPDGRYLGVIENNSTISLWDTSNSRLDLYKTFSTEKSNKNMLSKPVFNSQGTMAALVEDNFVAVVNFANGNIVYLPRSFVYVDKMVFNYNSSILAVSYSGNNYGTILWDTKSGNQIMEPLTDQVHSVFSSDGKYLASIDRKSGIVVRDMAAGIIVKKIPQKAPETIIKLFFTQNDKWLVSTDGNLLYLWDIKSGLSIGELSTGGEIQNIVFSPDGVTMAVTGCTEPANNNRCSHGEVTFWNLDPGAWKQKACDIAGRNLTQAEWAEYIPDKPYKATCAQFPAGD